MCETKVAVKEKVSVLEIFKNLSDEHKKIFALGEMCGEYKAAICASQMKQA